MLRTYKYIFTIHHVKNEKNLINYLIFTYLYKFRLLKNSKIYIVLKNMFEYVIN